MKTRQLLPGFAAASLLLIAASLQGQGRPAGLTDPGRDTPPPDIGLSITGDNQADPGYPAYKEGYALVLEGKWKEARKKFKEMLATYPKSDYKDDAQYWSAYSLKHIDRKAAAEEYQRFIEAHPQSRYYDDAMADLNDLRPQAVAGARPATGAVPAVASVTPRPDWPPLASPRRSMERAMRLELRQLGRLGHPQAFALPFRGIATEEELDPGTRLKMEALYALGETTEDDRSYTTLRDVAVDMHQPRPLREAAMDALTNFSKHDVLQVFVEIATKDTNKDIQGFAIDFIGEHGSDKNQRVTVLADLYRSLPRSRTDQRQTIVYTIADVGNDRAVDFLKNVAMSDEDFDLRRDAVYYLGNIGGEKARSALYEILKAK